MEYEYSYLPLHSTKNQTLTGIILYQPYTLLMYWKEGKVIAFRLLLVN